MSIGISHISLLSIMFRLKYEKEFRHSILLFCVTQHGRMMAMDGTSCMKHDLQKLDGLMGFYNVSTNIEHLGRSGWMSGTNRM